LLVLLLHIVGILLEIGEEKRPIDWMQEVIEGGDRKLGGVTAPADGLYLVSVVYPSEFDLNTEIITPFMGVCHN